VSPFVLSPSRLSLGSPSSAGKRSLTLRLPLPAAIQTRADRWAGFHRRAAGDWRRPRWPGSAKLLDRRGGRGSE
jgi:hypothetical protein